MNKTELLAKLEAIDAQGLNASVSVKEMIQLINQLEDFSPALNDDLINELSDEIADEISDEGVDLLDDFELGMNRNEVFIESIDFSKGTIALISKRILHKYIYEAEEV